MSNIYTLLESVPAISVVKISQLEDVLGDLKNVNSNETGKNIDAVKKCLNNVFGQTARCVEVIMGDVESDFFGMSIYPSAKSLSSIANDIADVRIPTKEAVEKILNTNIEYAVELDPKILSDVYNFKPAELTAMLLHEIGHVTTNTDFYATIKDAYTNAVMDVNNSTKLSDRVMSEKDVYVGMLYILSSIEKTHIKTLTADNLAKEKLADKFVFECGYGGALYSSLTKFNKHYMNLYKKSKKSDIIDREAIRFMTLSNMFNARRQSILKVLAKELPRSGSKTFKAIISHIIDSGKRISLSEDCAIFENKTLGDSILNEGFISDWIKRPVKMTGADLDYLKIDADRMRNYDEKSTLVYKIHKRMNELEKAKKTIMSSKYTEEDREYYDKHIKYYSTSLSELLKTVLSKKIEPGLKYGVYLKYPGGYEG